MHLTDITVYIMSITQSVGMVADKFENSLKQKIKILHTFKLHHRQWTFKFFCNCISTCL